MIKDYGLVNYYKNKSKLFPDSRGPILGLSVDKSSYSRARTHFDK